MCRLSGGDVVAVEVDRRLTTHLEGEKSTHYRLCDLLSPFALRHPTKPNIALGTANRRFGATCSASTRINATVPF